MPKLWKKKGRELPPDAVCRNCGVPLAGRYCHSCGQDFFAGEGRPILQFVANLLSNAFALDNKVLLTLRYLLFKPGFLSNEYKLGRIVRYVQPVKLFWMLTLLFFALLFATKGAENKRAQQQETLEPKTEQQAAPTIETTPPTEMEAATISTVKENTKKPDIQASFMGEDIVVVDNIIGGEEDDELGKQIVSYMKTFAPYATFLLIPLFAFLLKLFFWRKKYFYLHHLTFAVHFHSFLWILWSLLLIIDIIFPAWNFPGLLKLFIFLLPGFYLMIASYRFYQPKRKWSVIWKALVIGPLYLILIVLFMGIVALLIILMIKGIDFLEEIEIFSFQ